MNCQARALKPDVVLMDIRILVVTTFDEDEHVFKALRGGASGFVLKDTRPERLLDAIAIVAALSLSVATVKTHISRLPDKLGCRDRAQLVVVAYETGVAIPGLRLPTIRSQALNIHTVNDQEAISLSGPLILAMHGEQSVSSVILGMVPAALCSQSGLEAPRARPARSGHPRAHEPRGALASP